MIADSYQKKGKLTTYLEVVSYMLEHYSTDNVIAEDKAEITKVKPPADMTVVLYFTEFWEKTRRSGMVYS